MCQLFFLTIRIYAEELNHFCKFTFVRLKRNCPVKRRAWGSKKPCHDAIGTGQDRYGLNPYFDAFFVGAFNVKS